MGVITQGILGAVSGRIGPVVGGSWKGIAYLRGYQDQVAQPNTALQVAQKQRMSIVVFMAKTILTTIIKPLNDRFAVRMSGYNLFVSRNIEHIDANGVVDFPSLVTAEGTLTGFDTLAATNANGSADVDFTWVDNSGTGTALATDEVYLWCFNSTNDAAGTLSGGVARSAAAATVTLSDVSTTNDDVNCYCAYRKANGFAVSNSEYLLVTSA